MRAIINLLDDVLFGRSLEFRRGAILLGWSLALIRIPALADFSGYVHLGVLLDWTGDPRAVLVLVGSIIGGLAILADMAEIDVLRRMAAIASVAFWLLVASGFYGPGAAPSAAVIYTGMAWLNLRTAVGLPAR